MVAEGATIITQKNNEAFLDKALNTPRTLLNDTLAKNPKKAKVEAVAEKKVYSDGTRTVELYHVFPAPHSNGLLIAFIPKEKILLQGDFTVTPGQPANDHVKALGVGLLSNEVDSWMTGINRNVEGKQTRIVARYSGSAPAYRARCDDVAARGYSELALS